MSFDDVLGMIPALNSAVLIGLVGLLIRAGLTNRKMTLEDNRGLRTEFIEEMHALRDEVKGLRDENESLRREVRELHGVIDGLRRETLTGALTAQRQIVERYPPESVPEAINDAMRQLDRVPGVGK